MSFSWRLLLVVVFALALAAPAPAAAAPISPKQLTAAVQRVRDALTTVEDASAITADQSYAYRRSLRESMRVLRSLDQPSKQTRHDELGSQVLTLAALARRGDLTAARLPALFHQLDANRTWFAARAAPAALSRVQVAGDPIVYGYYPGAGLQLQPLFNWSQANTLWFAQDIKGLTTLVQALIPLLVEQPGGWATWEYEWDYQKGKAPWRSAMAQAVAVQALARTWHATGDATYLDVARRLLPGLGIPTDQGGLLDPGDARWWPLYSFDPGFRVLNGDLQVVISLYDYADLSGDVQAREWADEGAQAAAAALPAYDTGAWSRYSRDEDADLNYHDLMTKQLGQLALRTANPVFRDYANRFAAYRTTPPVLSPTTQAATPVLYPQPQDGFRDTGGVDVVLDKPASLTITVRDANGRSVAAERLGARDGGRSLVTWNGLSAGRPAPPGTYSLEVAAVDLAGNRAAAVPVGDVEVARDETPPVLQRLRVGRAADGRVRVRWAVHDDETPTVSLRVRVGRRVATLNAVPLAGVRTLDLRPVRHAYTADIRVWDTSGNQVGATRKP